MNILVIGSSQNFNECQNKFGEKHTYLYQNNHQDAEKLIAQSDIIFDFVIHQQVDQMEVYRDHPHATAFLNTTTRSLHQLIAASKQTIATTLFGFCGLPTLLNRSVLEVSLFKSEELKRLQEICAVLNTDYVVVDDRVGLITPRVICMIINEAFFTVQEGTASKADIDLGMKLGTNYPYGPFEWTERFGVNLVYDTLQALYDDTHDERYKICSLLKQEALKEQIKQQNLA